MIGEPTSDFAVQDEGNIIYMCTMLGYFMLQRFGLWELGPWRLHWVPSPVPWKSSDLNCWHGPWLVHDVALNYRPLHTRDWVPMTNYTSSTLIVKIIIKKLKKKKKTGAGASSLHTTLEGPTEYVNARWIKSLHGFLHGTKWIMVCIHLDYFQKPPLGGKLNKKPLGDHGTRRKMYLQACPGNWWMYGRELRNVSFFRFDSDDRQVKTLP